MKNATAIIFYLLFATMAHAQDKETWHKCKCATAVKEECGWVASQIKNGKLPEWCVQRHSKPAQDKCLRPDCSWLNTKNGDLTATTLPGPYDVAYHWLGWNSYKDKVRPICRAPDNTCTKETRDWLAGK